jgi:hypothetical protein
MAGRKPPTGRDPLRLWCPWCGAAPGQPCETVYGARATVAPHYVRRTEVTV